MKSLLTLAAVVAALAFATPAGAMPIIDPPTVPHHEVASPPPPADTHDGTSLLVVVIVGGVAFLGGAAAARLAPLPAGARPRASGPYRRARRAHDRGELLVEARRRSAGELVGRHDVPSGPVRSNVCVASSANRTS